MFARFRASWRLSLTCAALLTGVCALRAEEQPWRFVAFGDSINFEAGLPVNTNIVAELAAQVVDQRASFLLFLGDFSAYGTADGLSLWTNAMTPVFQAGIPIYPVLGNHDYFNFPAVSNVFGYLLPTNGPEGEKGMTYALQYKNALVLSLNQFVATNQYAMNQPWIDAVLATNTLPHVFAAGHMPAFKVYHRDSLNYQPERRDRFWHSLSNANARIYISGHDHLYDHCRLDDGDGAEVNDLHQFIVGTGGAPLYPDAPYDGTNGVWNPVRVAHGMQYGYLLVEVAGDRVTTSWHYRAGPNSYVRGPDVFSYSSTQGPVLQHSYVPGCLTLRWSGFSTLQSAPAMGGPFKDVTGAVSPHVVTDLRGQCLFYRLVAP